MSDTDHIPSPESSANQPASALTGNELSALAVTLLRGPLYREAKPALWAALERYRDRTADYVAVLGLALLIDDDEGYAFLRSATTSTDDDGGGDDGETGSENAVPRLMARRPLTFPVSLLLALLRKRLAESDTERGELRLVMTRAGIADMLKVFLPDETNEVKILDRIDATINKVVELGFLRPLQNAAGSRSDKREKRYEVRRILQAYVDAQWLDEFDGRLDEYRQRLATEASSGNDSDAETGR